MGLDVRPDRQRPQVLDALGEAIVGGQQTAEYLWQVPDDAIARARIVELLQTIATESEKKGRREMPRLCGELLRAMRASPSPQQVDLLQDGFHRLYRLWEAARSGLV